MNKQSKVLMAIALSLCVGMLDSAIAFADEGKSPKSQGGFGNLDASQFKLDMILAQRGDPDAQYHVGNAYEEGRGTQKNLKQAFEWYSKAAQQNQYEAEYKLGSLYENGMGVRQDYKKAMEWYKRAAENSCSQVRDRLNQQAYDHRKEEMKRSLATMKVEQEQRDKEQRAKELRDKEQQEKEQRERERKTAEERARQEAARKQQATVQKKKIVMASAERVTITDISDVVLKNKWSNGSVPADYLPSDSTHCLRASGSEIVCFSDEKQRVIAGQQVTFTTKATLSDFKTDGSFQVKYNYNAVQVGKASSPGISVDPNGLKLAQGWQEPPLSMVCRTADRVNLYCSRGNIKLHYHH
ncbi:MAG: hypothetical protein GC149_02090 [Gammaproteobacteria bacterium]|nr:hypothetical protein [Gammaproteobacteria bacterium]